MTTGKRRKEWLGCHSTYVNWLCHLGMSNGPAAIDHF